MAGRTANKSQLQVLYGVLADALPQEGRDYAIELTTTDSGVITNVVLRGITPIGDAWVPHAMKSLRAYSEAVRQRKKGTENDKGGGHD